jgi:hypothetical protein
MKELRTKILRPEIESVLGGGRKNISPFDIIPHLPDENCFFDPVIGFMVQTFFRSHSLLV